MKILVCFFLKVLFVFVVLVFGGCVFIDFDLDDFYGLVYFEVKFYFFYI